MSPERGDQRALIVAVRHVDHQAVWPTAPEHFGAARRGGAIFRPCRFPPVHPRDVYWVASVSSPEHREDLVTAGTTPPMTDTPEDRTINQQLDDVERRLVAQYAGQRSMPEDRVRGVVHAVRARFVHARVRTYLPILVERAARAELAA
jgi:hypothetical protein